MVVALMVAVLLIAADQVLKWLALEYLAPVSSIPLVEGVLHLHYVENRGAAFGILKGNSFLLIGLVAVLLVGIFVVIVMRIIRQPFIIWAFSLILAGGAGNLIDRIFRGYVIDYIYFVPINFPVFNLADICVTVGTGLVLIYVIFIEPKEVRKNRIFYH